MALKKPFRTLDTFSMSSMTDVIFLLLIFFMVTSTVIFPGAIEVNLPQSTEQTSLKPVTEVYLDSAANIYLILDRNDSTMREVKHEPISPDQLYTSLNMLHQNDSSRIISLYADTRVPYGQVVEILDIASRNRLKMVLATRASQAVDHIVEQQNATQQP